MTDREGWGAPLPEPAEEALRHCFEIETEWKAAEAFLPDRNEFRACCSCGWNGVSFWGNPTAARTEWETRHLAEPPKAEDP